MCVPSQMDAAVEQLVDDALATLPDVLRAQCERAAILAGLANLGALTPSLLHDLLEQDYSEVKAALEKHLLAPTQASGRKRGR